MEQPQNNNTLKHIQNLLSIKGTVMEHKEHIYRSYLKHGKIGNRVNENITRAHLGHRQGTHSMPALPLPCLCPSPALNLPYSCFLLSMLLLRCFGWGQKHVQFCPALQVLFMLYQFLNWFYVCSISFIQVLFQFFQSSIHVYSISNNWKRTNQRVYPI